MSASVANDADEDAAKQGKVRYISRTDAACATAVVLLTSVHLAYYFPRVVDDLFISLRFAENLARGHGAVYNVGERVEGYSSPLWMLLQSFGIALGFEGVTWTKALACAALLSMEYALFRLCRDVFRIEGAVAWIPSFFCAANSYVMSWTVLGLETPLHLALIVASPVLVTTAWRAPTRRRRAAANAALVALGLTRPEAVLYLAANAAGPMEVSPSARAILEQLKHAAKLLAPALGILVFCLLVRRAYYGYFVPNTYFVKGSGEPFDIEKLAPLWRQGASPYEGAVVWGGLGLLAYYGATRRALAPILSSVACLYFTAAVRLDWMPSLRHLLPVTVLAPVGWACLTRTILDRRVTWQKALAVPAIVLLGAAAASIASIDNRNSPEERRGGAWIRPKTAAKWHDTLLAYRRVEPEQIRKMGKYGMGQITQAWHVLEASAAPVKDSWFIGRDIGAVGYYTNVRVYDTAGLFTAEVAHSPEWTNEHRVTDELIARAMGRRPLAGEIYEGWERALGKHPELLRGYRIRKGSMRRPVAFLAIDRPRPEPSVVVQRYEDMVAKFPRLYHLQTLYGQSVGAAVEKRLRVVREQHGATD